MLDVIAAIDKGIGPGAALAGLGALGVLLALALGRGAVGLAAYARSRRGAGEVVEAAASVPDVSPIQAAASAQKAVARRSISREEFCERFVAHLLKTEIFDSYIVADLLSEASWYADRHNLELPGRELLLSQMSETAGVRVWRGRIQARHDLAHIRKRLETLGMSTEKPVIYFVQDPAARAVGASGPATGRAPLQGTARAVTGQAPAKARKQKKNRTITAVRTPSEQGELLVGYELAA